MVHLRERIRNEIIYTGGPMVKPWTVRSWFVGSYSVPKSLEAVSSSVLSSEEHMP